MNTNGGGPDLLADLGEVGSGGQPHAMSLAQGIMVLLMMPTASDE